MKEKLKYNFLHIVAFFEIPSDQKRRRKAICQGGLKKGTLYFKKVLFQKKSFTELPFRIATVFSAKI